MPALLLESLKAELHELQRRIGYFFHNEGHLVEALVHRSYASEKGLPFDNERLEFLGDAFVNFAVGVELFKRLEDASEGVLTRKRAELVREEALAYLAKQIGLGDFLLFGKGERRQGGALRDSNLADAFEALIGAVLVDGGIHEAYRVLTALLFSADIPPFKDYKSSFFNLCSRLKLRPLFRFESLNGIFKVELVIDGFKAVVFAGSKKEGEREAAKAALSYLSSRGMGVAQDSSSK
ncbi:MAG: ribonuclease III [Deferribacteres bacterium]|nr:ribonuclease III [Deferribacteres bacterium]